MLGAAHGEGMFEFMKSQREYILVALCDGIAIPMEEVPNSIFSHKKMGEGIAFVPKGKQFVAPAAGTVKYIPENLQTIGMTLENGLGIVIHFGLDSVMLKADDICIYCKEGQKVVEGEVLIELKGDGKPQLEGEWFVPVAIIKHEDFGEFQFILEGEMEAGVTEVVKYSRQGKNYIKELSNT